MFKNILYINLIFSFALALVIYISQKLGVSTPLLINNYVNDFLIIPIVLSVCLYILRYTRNNKFYKIQLLVILFLCGAYSVFFEVFMPKIKLRYTADIFDVIAYFLGGFWFYLLQKRS